MKRDNEFRGKCPDNGEWYFGSLVVMKNGQTEIVTNEVDDVICRVNVIPETVEQYTSLKDNKGAKIFEGDIVEFHNTEGQIFRQVVRWDKKLLCYSYGVMPYKNIVESSYYHNLDENVNVIGNIYDNPELLDVQE
jgi:uncharacterized phage protein (TIGR01671 family)